SLKDIRGAMPISGVYRIHDVQINAGVPLPRGARQADAASGRNPTLPFSSVFGSDPKVRRDASPLVHLKPALPPFLVLYAAHDLMKLPAMAREFDAALKKEKCAVQAVEVKQRNHMSILLNITQEGDPAGQAILGFITKPPRQQPAVGSKIPSSNDE